MRARPPAWKGWGAAGSWQTRSLEAASPQDPPPGRGGAPALLVAGYPDEAQGWDPGGADGHWEGLLGCDSPGLVLEEAQGWLQKREEGGRAEWESWGCRGAASQEVSPGRPQGHQKTCGGGRWGWAGWGPRGRVPALEGPWRRDLTRQMALGREVFWEWRRGLSEGRGPEDFSSEPCPGRGLGLEVPLPPFQAGWGAAHGRSQASF